MKRLQLGNIGFIQILMLLSILGAGSTSEVSSSLKLAFMNDQHLDETYTYTYRDTIF